MAFSRQLSRYSYRMVHLSLRTYLMNVKILGCLIIPSKYQSYCSRECYIFSNFPKNKTFLMEYYFFQVGHFYYKKGNHLLP